MKKKKDYLDKITDPYEFLEAVKREMAEYQSKIDSLLSNKGPELRPFGERSNRPMGFKERQKAYLQAAQQLRWRETMEKFNERDPYSKVRDPKDLEEAFRDTYYPDPDKPYIKTKGVTEEKNLEEAQKSFWNLKRDYNEMHQTKQDASKDDRDL